MFKNLYKFKNLPEWRGVYFNDDLPQKKQDERKELRAIFSFAKSKGISCQLCGQRLIIDGKPYTYADSRNLPHNLSIEAAKMIEVEDGLAFQSKHALLSNLYPCNIKFEGKDITSVEQGLQNKHAIVCKRPDIADKMMTTQDPEKIMYIARALPDSDEWNDMELDVCRDLNKVKYQQTQN